MAPAAVMAGSHADDQQHSAAHSVHSGSTSGGILRKASVGQAVSSKRPQGYSAKPAGVASPGSHPAHAGLRNVVMQPHEVRETLQQKQLLKVEMQRIFLYYSTLSNAGPPDGINPQKWFRLCHDTGCVATNRHYARGTPSHEWRPAANGLLPKADADAVFAEAAAETGAKATNNLNFDGFMVACRRLAKQMHPALAASPNDALHRLLCEHVLPKALRATEDLLLVDAHDEACEELFTKYRKGLTMLFNGYSPPGPGGRARVGEMQLPQFQRAMADFKIVPCLLSNAECNQVYHAARLDAGQPPLAHFQNCLVRAAHVAFSRHPYSANGNRPQQKLFDLLDRLSVPDPISLKHHLERLGMKVAPSSRSNTPPSVRPMTPKYPEVTLDDEEGLDRALKQIFAAYSTAGRMDLSKFVKLCVDTKVAHRIEFTRGQVEQTFHEASRDMFLSFDEWCDALLLLGQSRFPHDNQSDALRNLLSGYLLPLADRRLSVA
ncbi:Tip elongation aberrant protein 1 [Diplonema papillatum]|nr:Tip elongation aberrant protein 1 [Diplonema papillatum]